MNRPTLDQALTAAKILKAYVENTENPLRMELDFFIDCSKDLDEMLDEAKAELKSRPKPA